MSREDRERLHDILEAIDAIRRHAASADSAPPEVIRDAILYRLVVIGEAVKAIPESLRAVEPGFNWRGIAGLRDILTHAYFRIERDRVDGIVERDREPSEDAVTRLLGSLD